MIVFMNRTSSAIAASLLAAASITAASGPAEARAHHRAHKTVPAAEAQPRAVQERQAARQQGVAGYFGPGAYGPYGYGPFGPFSAGYAYGYPAPHGDLGFALLGAANGGGLRGFVECGNYYARYPGACGF